MKVMLYAGKKSVISEGTMKKLEKIFMCFAVFSLLFFNVVYVKASDAGYVYEELNVYVQINEAREYRVTEKMVIDFEEEMHGIVRDIPLSSDVEKIGVKDIYVTGMPYKVSEDFDNVEIRIGDPDQLVVGRKEVTLEYTLTHYQDYDHDYDYVYLNVLGTDYDAEVHRFHAEVEFPFADELDKYKVTSGRYGSTSNQYVNEYLDGNKLILDANENVPPNTGITVQMRFPEGVFTAAPQYVYPYVIKNNDLKIEVSKNQEFVVTQKIDYQANNNYVMIEIPMISANWSTDYRIDDFNAVGNGSVKDYDDLYYVNVKEGEGRVTVSYTVHPFNLINGEISLKLNEPTQDTKTEHFSLALTMPYIPEVSVYLQRYNDHTKGDRFEISEVDDSLFIKTNDAIEAAEEFILHVPMKASYFTRSIGFYSFFAVILSVALLIVVGIFRFVIYRKSNLVIPVNFYPPKGMNSAEAGYVVDLEVTDTDITSLIFYWADRGYLKIHEIDKAYSFEKIRNADGLMADYEQKLFNRMFDYGKDGFVNKKQLRSFYRDVKDAKKGILNKYTKEKNLALKSAEMIRKFFSNISLMPLFFYLILSNYEIYQNRFGIIIVCVVMVPMFIMAQRTISSMTKKDDGIQSKMFIVIGGFFVLMFLSISVIISRVQLNMLFYVCAICSIAMLVLSKGIHKDTKYREELLAPLLGFKDFIKLVEKDKLEMLLEEDPEYYYHVLPFAQVLHVSNIWINKFKDITLPLPEWYVGERLDMRDFSYVIRDIEREMNQSVSRPKSSGSSFSSSGGSSNGGYSGGGGGFSSGGSSGGGSGGGGSHGW